MGGAAQKPISKYPGNGEPCGNPSLDYSVLSVGGPIIVEHRLLLRVMHQLDETREWLFTLGQLKAPERLASFLLWLRRKKELALGTLPLQPDENMVGCPYSRQDIADFLGLTVETVSRNFTKFRQDNLINLHADKRIEILDTDALKRLAGTTLPGAEV